MNQALREDWVRPGWFLGVCLGVLAGCLALAGCGVVRKDFVVTAQPPHARIAVVGEADERGSSAEHRFTQQFKGGQDEVAVRVTAPGYEPQTLFLDRRSQTNHRLDLKPLQRTVFLRVIPADGLSVVLSQRPTMPHTGPRAVLPEKDRPGTYRLDLEFGHEKTAGSPVRWYEVSISRPGLEPERRVFEISGETGVRVSGGRSDDGRTRMLAFERGDSTLDVWMRPAMDKRELVFSYGDLKDIEGLRVRVDGELLREVSGETATIRFAPSRMRVDRRVRVVAQAEHFQRVEYELDWLDASGGLRRVIPLEPRGHDVTVMLAIEREQGPEGIDIGNIDVQIGDERATVGGFDRETMRLLIRNLTFVPDAENKVGTWPVQVEARVGDRTWRGRMLLGKEHVEEEPTLKLFDSRDVRVSNRMVRVAPDSEKRGGPWQFRLDDSDPEMIRRVAPDSSRVALVYEPDWPWDVLSFDVHPSGRWMVVSEIAPSPNHRRGFQTRVVLVDLVKTDRKPRELIGSDRRSWSIEPRFSKTEAAVIIWYLSDAVGGQEDADMGVRLWRIMLSNDGSGHDQGHVMPAAMPGRQYVAFDELRHNWSRVLVVREVEWATGNSRLVTLRPGETGREWQEAVPIGPADPNVANGDIDGHRFRVSPTGLRLVVSRQQGERDDRERMYLVELLSRGEKAGGFVYSAMNPIRQDDDRRLGRLPVWSPCGSRLAWVRYDVERNLAIDWHAAGIESAEFLEGLLVESRSVRIPASEAGRQVAPVDQVIWSKDGANEVGDEVAAGGGRVFFRYLGSHGRALWSMPLD